MATNAQRLLDINDKRLATLQKSLEKKRRALKVQEEMFASEPREELRNHPTYIYYQKELAAAEEAYEKKCKYYNDAIDALKEKLATTKPTGKVYRRLLAEVEMEQREYDELSKQLNDGRELIQVKEVERMRLEAAARAKEEERKEREEKQRLQEQLRIAKEAERAEEERRAKERAEEAKKQYTEKPASQLLQRIADAKTTEELTALCNEYDAQKKKFSDEEDALWMERFDDLEAKECREREEAANRDDETTNSIVSDPPAEPAPQRKNFYEMTLLELYSLDCSPFTPNEMALYTAAIESKQPYKTAKAANASKTTPLAPPKPVGENSILGSAQILKTTKMLPKTPGVPAQRLLRPF